jgi:hypothetical protein
MELEFWVDPGCPFCWTTARWLVDEVQPHRDLEVAWRPISLLEKNQPAPGSPYHAVTTFTHGLLRTMESVRTTDGDDGVFRLYWELGSRIHHDGDRSFDAKDALAAVGLDTMHARAVDDPSWDTVIGGSMNDAFSLVGTDVGTPIIAFADSRGRRTGYFGPVLSAVPDTDDSLTMWDALVAMMEVDEFYELKRTRTSRPDPGPRPTPH